MESADMPYLYRTTGLAPESAWIVMAHEQWHPDGSCSLGVKLYYSEDYLLNGLK